MKEVKNWTGGSKATQRTAEVWRPEESQGAWELGTQKKVSLMGSETWRSCSHCQRCYLKHRGNISWLPPSSSSSVTCQWTSLWARSQLAREPGKYSLHSQQSRGRLGNKCERKQANDQPRGYMIHLRNAYSLGFLTCIMGILSLPIMVVGGIKWLSICFIWVSIVVRNSFTQRTSSKWSGRGETVKWCAWNQGSRGPSPGPSFTVTREEPNRQPPGGGAGMTVELGLLEVEIRKTLGSPSTPLHPWGGSCRTLLFFPTLLCLQISLWV